MIQTGSSDSSEEVISSLNGGTVKSQKNRGGKSLSIRGGFAFATSCALLFDDGEEVGAFSTLKLLQILGRG